MWFIWCHLVRKFHIRFYRVNEKASEIWILNVTYKCIIFKFDLCIWILFLTSFSTIFQVCRVWLDQVEHCHVDTRFMHTICGHLVNKASNGDVECKFCGRICNTEVECTFHLEITIADETGKIFASCIGQTAAELLQISPDEFAQLPEVKTCLSTFCTFYFYIRKWESSILEKFWRN